MLFVLGVVSIVLVMSVLVAFNGVLPVSKLDDVHAEEILCSDVFNTEKFVIFDDVLPFIGNREKIS